MHHHHLTPSGINIFLLDTKSSIDAEAEAMLQALHSRSTGGLLEHLKVLEKRGAANFMSQFYVGYGHKSIGDCGSMTVFVEGCSMLAAKAIQDSKLYNGQEASTRYIDFSKQAMVNPLGTETGTKILEDQRSFYLSLLPELVDYIKEQFPRQPEQDTKIYNKTVNAKAFDIARGFLPAGCSTNLAWHGTLRHISDRILQLRHHPLEEVREIAITLQQAVIEKYPHSFSDKTYEATEQYLETLSSHYYYHDKNCPSFACTQDNIDKPGLLNALELINQRPNGKTELPTFLDNLGTVRFNYQLDFGSFRDIQRHRAPYQRMPLLTTEIGFHSWYLESLPEHMKAKTLKHLETLQKSLNSLNCSKEVQQYYVPMGYRMSCEIMGTLPALIYLAELRSTTYVHPSLRPIAIQIGDYLEKTHGIATFIDRSEDEFDVRRGKHDIEIVG